MKKVNPCARRDVFENAEHMMPIIPTAARVLKIARYDVNTSMNDTPPIIKQIEIRGRVAKMRKKIYPRADVNFPINICDLLKPVTVKSSKVLLSRSVEIDVAGH